MSRNTKATDSLSQVFDWWATCFYQLDELVGLMQERLLLHCMSFPRFALHLQLPIALNKSNFVPFDAKSAAFQIYFGHLYQTICVMPFFSRAGKSLQTSMVHKGRLVGWCVKYRRVNTASLCFRALYIKKCRALRGSCLFPGSASN